MHLMAFSERRREAVFLFGRSIFGMSAIDAVDGSSTGT
jgi:hypothetical protein